jgi:hypothetical protein
MIVSSWSCLSPVIAIVMRLKLLVETSLSVIDFCVRIFPENSSLGGLICLS